MMDQPTTAVCQSCGMPLAQDPQGGGTEADGSTSPAYCSHCYQGGKFTLPDLTSSEMVERVQGRLRSMQIPELQVNVLSAGIPSLRRWRAEA